FRSGTGDDWMPPATPHPAFPGSPTELPLNSYTRCTHRNGAVRIVRHVVARERASVRALVVTHRRTRIRRHHIRVEADQTLPGCVRTAVAHAMPRMAGRTAKSRIDVLRMFREAGILHDIRQIVALRAHRVRTVHAEIRVRKHISDRP